MIHEKILHPVTENVYRTIIIEGPQPIRKPIGSEISFIAANLNWTRFSFLFRQEAEICSGQ
jgi:hypothetical protein